MKFWQARTIRVFVDKYLTWLENHRYEKYKTIDLKQNFDPYLVKFWLRK